MSKGMESRKFNVNGVCCSTEEAVLRKKLNAVIGPDTYAYNSVTSELRTAVAVDPSRILHAVRAAGFTATLQGQDPAEQSFLRGHAMTVQLIVAVIVALAGVVLDTMGDPVPGRSLLALAIVVSGKDIFHKSLMALRQRCLDMNTLVTVATIGAMAIGKWEEAAAVVLLFSVSLLLEGYAARRTRRAIGSLMSLSPVEAVRVRDSVRSAVPAASVREGEVIFVLPGARIPLDGVVEEGNSSVSEAMLTGESTPVEKTPGSEVYAGCINERGTLSVRVTRRFEETRLAHIIHSIEDAQTQRAPVQSSIDRFAGVYTWVVIGVAAVVAFLPPVVLHQPFLPWIYRSLVLLVVACPCALVISTPVTFVSAMTAAARAGILIKGGRHVESLAHLKAMAFDKTGTLTEGRPVATDVISLNGMSEDRLLSLVGTIEAHSEHHLASAIMDRIRQQHINIRGLTVAEFEALPGRGIRADVDGTTYFVGNEAIAIEHGFDSALLVETVRQLEDDGKTVLTIGTEREPLGVVGLKDTPRKESREVIQALHAMGISRTILLSGDGKKIADAVAAELGMHIGEGSLLPADKVNAVKAMRSQFGVVGMVGDGINDAPALAAASVGIAMGRNGVDAALESADVVLMSDNIRLLPSLLHLARKAIRIIKQNITLALAVKAAFLVLSVAGATTLWMALLADDGAAILVIFNGIRALKRLS